ncbi:hypothetical protein EYZ11_001104 [Aspergillus tanneri]|uniref:DUF2470 domain-containing protein n=1 Tax=Aspergillus tanneri TaxID=1220188 RepID=A0A4V3UQM9_9EURO|nr:uncharacterized protein ATNIH1004_004425 [Aspergillus tanneri]KAA8648540.1 hypothetical protein ATNIH1004_004425 [Aspergillus tanneri]THC99380.1 hypothetical protein EYZ11_001104 [Aspergillus tanneri]
MATPTTTDQSTKGFIIKHMNADHQNSLAMYLQVYCHLSAAEAKSSRLEDISLSDLLISARGTRYTVPLDPPMKAFSETRSRVVAMHKECLQRLGISDIIIQEYRAPHGVYAIGFGICLAWLVGFYQRENFLPGSVLYETLGLERAPLIAQLCYKLQPLAFYGMLGAHVVEGSLLLAVKRLKPHGVPFLSGLWCVWMLSTLIEGFGGVYRFDDMVAEKRAMKEQKK